MIQIPIKTRATILHIEHSISNDVVFIRCKLDESGFSFQEGQFIMISIDSLIDEKGKTIKKAYSIATTQDELYNQGTIGFIVKYTHLGGMSDYLTHTIKLGDKITIEGPYGQMVHKPGFEKYLLISAGSGISPILGLYESIVAKQKNAKVAMLYGERYLQSMIPSLVKIFSKNSEHETKQQILHTLFLSKESIAGSTPVFRKTGHVQDGLQEAITFLGNGENGNISDILVYVCGMPEMTDNVAHMLQNMGMVRENIFFEKY